MTYQNLCLACNQVFDWLAPRFSTPDPPCPACSGPTERQITAPAILWSKPLCDYADRTKETFRKDQAMGAHVVFERDSDAAQAAGRPLKRVIRTMQDQRDYCKAEGLFNPADLPNNLSVAKDGQSYETTNRSEI